MRKFKQVKRKEIVFSLDEWNKIERLAAEANLNTTEYIRRMALDKKIVQMNMPDITHILNVMKSVANNLHQLAKKAHEINKIYAADFEKMGGEWRLLCHLLSAYLLEARSNAALLTAEEELRAETYKETLVKQNIESSSDYKYLKGVIAETEQKAASIREHFSKFGRIAFFLAGYVALLTVYADGSFAAARFLLIIRNRLVRQTPLYEL